MGLSREIEREKERGDQCVNPGILQSSPVKNGGVGKRLTPAVLKTVRPERVSWVRIPPPPPPHGVSFSREHRAKPQGRHLVTLASQRADQQSYLQLLDWSWCLFRDA